MASSMRSQRNSDGPWTSSRFRSARRAKSWQPSPPTKTRSPPATSLSAAEACGVSQSRRSRPAKVDRTGGHQDVAGLGRDRETSLGIVVCALVLLGWREGPKV
jgi:hypothetical protein